MRTFLSLLLAGILFLAETAAQPAPLRVVDAEGRPVAGATVTMVRHHRTMACDTAGILRIDRNLLPSPIVVSAVGYDTLRTMLDQLPLDVVLVVTERTAAAVTVVGNRTEDAYRSEPYLVDVTDRHDMEAVSAQSLSDALSYQPGMRMETDCRNCGFSQVRINGLPGPYTRMLLNGRPVLSALLGVYGLEQIPAVMIDRIEMVRGGGAIDGGPSAIAGTINVVTRDAERSVVSASAQGAGTALGGQDRSLSLFASIPMHDHTAGTATDGGLLAFGTIRERRAYDRDGDGFSDIPLMAQTAGGLGTTFHLAPTMRTDVALQWIRESRRGGDRLDVLPEHASITEQLDHSIVGATVRHSWLLGAASAVIVDAGLQRTDRHSYYGGLGPGRTADDSLQARAYYGATDDLVATAGLRWDYLPGSEPSTPAITAGVDVVYNHVDDRMPGQGRAIVQTTTTTGLFAQSRWQGLALLPSWTWGAVLGLRMDLASIDGLYRMTGSPTWNTRTIIGAPTPRVSFEARSLEGTTLRATYASGFRGPQAFDEDLHVSTLGGEARVIRLADGLAPERSHAFSLSWNGSLTESLTATIDGFTTVLQRPFVTRLTGDTIPGSGAMIAEKRNGDGAWVAGINAEVRYSNGSLTTMPTVTLQAAFTAQAGRYMAGAGEVVFDAVASAPSQSTRNMLRTPWMYGSWLASWYPSTSWTVSASGVVTGPMLVPHERRRVVVRSPWMADVALQATWWAGLGLPVDIGLTAAVQNVFDVFQRDIDTGAERDGAYVYGPSRPRTIRIGITTGQGLR